MHLAPADFNDLAKPLKLARAWDIFRPVRSQLFFTFGLKSRGFQTCGRSNVFAWFREVIQISWCQYMFDVQMTPWIWNSRAKTCASLKLYKNQHILIKLHVSRPKNVEIFENEQGHVTSIELHLFNPCRNYPIWEGWSNAFLTHLFSDCFKNKPDNAF